MRGPELKIFRDKDPKRFSAVVDGVALNAINLYYEELPASILHKHYVPEDKVTRTPEYLAANRAIHKALQQALVQFKITTTVDREMARMLDDRKDSFIEHQKINMAHMLAEEIIKSGIFEYDQWTNYHEEITEVSVAIFKSPNNKAR